LPSVPDPNLFEVEMFIENLERYKLPSNDEISAELIQAAI
jgi:hypothetical protein